MRYIFKFPDIGEGISEGKILKWYVQKGQNIKSQDPVVKMETDKVVTDIPSPKDGVVVALFGKEGEVINVDDPLLEIEIEGIEGEEAQQVAREKPEPSSKESVGEKGFGVVGTLEVAGDAAYLPSSQEGMTIPETAVPMRKALATPVARAMAKELGLDINRVPGTGPGDRVMKKDIQLFHDNVLSGDTSGDKIGDIESLRVEYRPLTQLRKTIARNMIQSKHSAAHMTIFEEVEISQLMKLRDSQKERFSREGMKLTYLAFVLKAVASALREFPLLNSEMDLENDRLVLKKYINIGIAVDTDDGLVVPVISDVDRLTIRNISQKIMEFADKSRERKLTLDDLKDGTFTVTNYGSIAGTFGVPVINYPQAAILGIGRIMKVPTVVGELVSVGHVLPLSLSVDHRIVDGGEAARFMLGVIEYLRDPFAMLLG